MFCKIGFSVQYKGILLFLSKATDYMISFCIVDQYDLSMTNYCQLKHQVFYPYLWYLSLHCLKIRLNY